MSDLAAVVGIKRPHDGSDAPAAKRPKYELNDTSLAQTLPSLLDTLSQRDEQSFFQTHENPNYMSFSVMRRKVAEGSYASMQEFQNDFSLICQQAMQSLPPETAQFQKAAKLYQTGSRLISLATKNDGRAVGGQQQQPAGSVVRTNDQPLAAPGDSLGPHSAALLQQQQAALVQQQQLQQNMIHREASVSRGDADRKRGRGRGATAMSASGYTASASARQYEPPPTQKPPTAAPPAPNLDNKPPSGADWLRDRLRATPKVDGHHRVLRHHWMGGDTRHQPSYSESAIAELSKRSNEEAIMGHMFASYGDDLAAYGSSLEKFVAGLGREAYAQVQLRLHELTQGVLGGVRDEEGRLYNARRRALRLSKRPTEGSKDVKMEDAAKPTAATSTAVAPPAPDAVPTPPVATTTAPSSAGLPPSGGPYMNLHSQSIAPRPATVPVASGVPTSAPSGGSAPGNAPMLRQQTQSTKAVINDMKDLPAGVSMTLTKQELELLMSMRSQGLDMTFVPSLVKRSSSSGAHPQGVSAAPVPSSSNGTGEHAHAHHSAPPVVTPVPNIPAVTRPLMPMGGPPVVPVVPRHPTGSLPAGSMPINPPMIAGAGGPMRSSGMGAGAGHAGVAQGHPLSVPSRAPAAPVAVEEVSSGSGDEGSGGDVPAPPLPLKSSQVPAGYPPMPAAQRVGQPSAALPAVTRIVQPSSVPPMSVPLRTSLSGALPLQSSAVTPVNSVQVPPQLAVSVASVAIPSALPQTVPMGMGSVAGLTVPRPISVATPLKPLSATEIKLPDTAAAAAAAAAKDEAPLPAGAVKFGVIDPNAKEVPLTRAPSPPPDAKAAPVNRNGICDNCGPCETPGWRIGPDDKKKLCNACGLYYAKNKNHRPENLWKTKKKP